MTRTLTVAEHARLRGVTLTHVYNELRAGRISGAKKIGRVWRIPLRNTRRPQEPQTEQPAEQR